MNFGTASLLRRPHKVWCEVSVSLLFLSLIHRRQVERFNRTIQKTLAVLCPDNRNWSEHVDDAIAAYNRTEHSVTTMAPAVAWYCSLYDTFDEAVAAGLSRASLDAEMRKHLNKTISSVKIKIKSIIHVRLVILLQHLIPQEKN